MVLWSSYMLFSLYSFIKQYYEKLARNPQDLYKFYKENSFFTFVDSAQDSDPIGGPDDIKEAVAKLPFLNCLVDLSEGSLDAQTSDGGVLIVVTGDIAFPGESQRHFVQSFFLDSQHSGPSPSYYVRNSVFRLLRSHSASNHSVAAPTTEEDVSAAEESIANLAVDSPVEPISMSEIAAPAHVAAPMEPVSAVSDVTEPSTSDAETTSEAEMMTPVESPAAFEPTSAHAPEQTPATVNSGPMSYRDMLRAGAKGGATTAPAPAPAPAPKKKAVTPKPAAAASPAAPTEQQASKHVLHVRYQDSTTVDELKSIFSPFGNIIKCDVLNPKNYAFIQFDHADASQAALAAAPSLALKGKPISVEERNVSTSRQRGSNGGGGANSSSSSSNNNKDTKDRKQFRENKSGAPAGEKDGAQKDASKSGGRQKDNKDGRPDGDRPRSGRSSAGKSSTEKPSAAASSVAAKK
jgi:RNA recognition motif-containing protein